MPKPFFYRIDAAEFVAAVLQIPDGQHKQWVTQLALDMVSGTGTMDFSKKIIEEVENYRKKQAEAGAKGGKPKHKQPYSDPIPEKSDTVPPPKQNLGNSSNNSSNRNNKEKPNKTGEFILPEWVPVEAWEGFVEMRSKIKKPMTDHAKQLRINDLKKLVESGEDPGAVLDQSTASSWQDLYAVKNKPSPQPPQQNPAAYIPGTPEYKARLKSDFLRSI